MLKRLLSAVAAGILWLSMVPAVGMAEASYEVLQVGDEDAWVMELQEKLNELGYLSVPATGYYGTNTQNAVLKYQRDHGLYADGKAGPETRESILGEEYEPITGPRTQERNHQTLSVHPGASSVNGTLSGGSAAQETAPGREALPEAAAPAPAPAPPAETEPSPTPQPTSSASTQPTTAPSASVDPAPTTAPSAPPDAGAAPAPDEIGPGDDESSSEGNVPTGDILKLGDKGDAVSTLQQRLKDLEYYDYGSITGYYGPVTEEAVKKFERTNGLEEDGVMSLEDLELLNKETAPYYSMFPGDEGDDILEMQERLIQLGYLDTEANGYYGTSTTLAVKAFQEKNGLVADGTAGKQTRAVLFSEKAVASDGAAAEDSEMSETEDIPGTGVTKMINVAQSQAGKRYSYGSSGPNAYDCSGLVYYAMKGAGVQIGRMSSAGYAQVSAWQTIKSVKDLKIGDLVFFRSDSSSRISHVGIYLGDGKFVHSAPSIGGVGTSTMATGYYARNFVTAKRIF